MSPPPFQTGQCQYSRRQNGPVRMYVCLLFKRYSRLAALYSILEIGRQPSLGGRGFAIADAQASSDAAILVNSAGMSWRGTLDTYRAFFS